MIILIMEYFFLKLVYKMWNLVKLGRNIVVFVFWNNYIVVCISFFLFNRLYIIILNFECLFRYERCELFIE